ncbi:MAG: hypothetical protein C7B45_15580 [Sulfobacillus acidophilus]|uniref:HTH cro/C1-type domain-containing protein n=1 Tax=Sulfobacillus acidophilus TaxID=53633 RepID=A0A2T2WDH9_9FIRM|nr:MAG: hypothetical protein C7B45_15580 [Sulfobacillus acidophilus]
MNAAKNLVHPWRTLRELNNLTQSEVAQQTGVNQSHYSHIERGSSRASSRMVARLLAVLPPPSRLDHRAIASALDNATALDDPQWETTVELLAQSWPAWERNTRNALNMPSDPPLSSEAQPGLVWLVCQGAPAIVPPDLFSPGLASDAVVEKWIALSLKIQSDDIGQRAIKAVSAVIEARRSDPRWDDMSRSWPNLTEDQKAVVADLVRVFTEGG